jgi:hypothetical protein
VPTLPCIDTAFSVGWTPIRKVPPNM